VRALLHGVGRDAVRLRLGLVLPSDVFSSHTTFRGSTVHWFLMSDVRALLRSPPWMHMDNLTFTLTGTRVEY
jgi:hypothetical protein